MEIRHIFEIADFIAVALVQWGNYLKIKKSSYGWLLSMIAITYFIFRANCCGYYSQGIGHMISLSMATYGFISWRKAN